MPRRTATLLAATITLIALLCAGALIKVPYAEMSPGPTVNTLGEHDGDPVLDITGPPTYPTSGHLNMTTVRVTGANYRMNLLEAVSGWLSGNDTVVPKSTLYPDDKTAQQVDQENAEQFSQSQENAKVAAMKELHIPFRTRVVVASVVKDSAAEGRLHAGDVIKAVDGKQVKRMEDVAKLVTKHKAGEKTVFTVVPAKEAKKAEKAGKTPTGGREVTITTRKAPDDGRAIVGIAAANDHTFKFDIDIKLADVGGPSAGLMFTLGIVDKLTKTDLTGGEFVAGTGTIEADGTTVGPIGGIGLKTIGAHNKGAKFFLTPKENCAQAAKNVPGGLTLVKVHTVADAMGALKDIRTGNTDDLPLCKKS